MMINARDAFAKLPAEEQAAIKARAMKLAKLLDHFGMLSEARQLELMARAEELQCDELDLLEDEIDRQAAAAALKDAEEHGTVPWEDVKKELGLSAPSAPPGDSSDSV